MAGYSVLDAYYQKVGETEHPVGAVLLLLLQ